MINVGKYFYEVLRLDSFTLKTRQVFYNFEFQHFAVLDSNLLD